MTSNHHALYDLGYTRTTMAINRGKQNSDVEQTPKNGLSSDCRLQPACMKSELLVIADQHAAVNTFPGGVYKARERIHRSVADLRLLATPTSWGRVADPNPN